MAAGEEWQPHQLLLRRLVRLVVQQSDGSGRGMATAPAAPATVGAVGSTAETKV
jgi:hypothetical protein